MGALFNINFSYYDSFDGYLHEFKNHNLYPFMLQSKFKINEVNFKNPFSLIFGNEATGLSSEFSEIGQSVVIPHSNLIDSLNLPIAVSIAIYESTKNNF